MSNTSDTVLFVETVTGDRRPGDTTPKNKSAATAATKMCSTDTLEASASNAAGVATSVATDVAAGGASGKEPLSEELGDGRNLTMYFEFAGGVEGIQHSMINAIVLNNYDPKDYKKVMGEGAKQRKQRIDKLVKMHTLDDSVKEDLGKYAAKKWPTLLERGKGPKSAVLPKETKEKADTSAKFPEKVDGLTPEDVFHAMSGAVTFQLSLLGDDEKAISLQDGGFWKKVFREYIRCYGRLHKSLDQLQGMAEWRYDFSHDEAVSSLHGPASSDASSSPSGLHRSSAILLQLMSTSESLDILSDLTDASSTAPISQTACASAKLSKSSLEILCSQPGATPIDRKDVLHYALVGIVELMALLKHHPNDIPAETICGAPDDAAGVVDVATAASTTKLREYVSSAYEKLVTQLSSRKVLNLCCDFVNNCKVFSGILDLKSLNDQLYLKDGFHGTIMCVLPLHDSKCIAA